MFPSISVSFYSTWVCLFQLFASPTCISLACFSFVAVLLANRKLLLASFAQIVLFFGLFFTNTARRHTTRWIFFLPSIFCYCFFPNCIFLFPTLCPLSFFMLSGLKSDILFQSASTSSSAWREESSSNTSNPASLFQLLTSVFNFPHKYLHNIRHNIQRIT